MISDLNWLLKTSLQIIIRILEQSKLWTYVSDLFIDSSVWPSPKICAVLILAV